MRGIKLKILKYESILKNEWDNFVIKSKTDSFLFLRDYMDYHSNRFEDMSFIIYDDNDKIVALLPGNVSDKVFFSHQGLTYGGFITKVESKAKDFIEYFTLLNNFLLSNGVEKVIYKKIPYIYTNYLNDEDEYALFLLNSKIISCGISSTIKLNQKFKFNKSRKSCISKSKRFELTFKLSDNLEEFWEILEENLRSTHSSKPVHSLEEIKTLKDKFPENIKLFSVYEENKCVAGVVVYEMRNLVHIQYISASERGKEISALDFIFDKLIREIYIHKEYFDFGVSTEQGGRYLNEGLIFQKEGFGARGLCYKIYEYEVV